MPSTSRARIKQADLPVVLNELPSRRVSLRVLFVHRDAGIIDRCLQELRRGHFKVSADVILTPEQFARRLKAKYYDIVLVEYPSPNWRGAEALEILNLRDRRIPCIYLADTVLLETMAELITEGAADCVGMDHVGHLPVAIRRALNENNLREESRQTGKRLGQSEARLRAFLGNLNYGMFRFNAKGHFFEVNQALVIMLCYP